MEAVVFSARSAGWLKAVLILIKSLLVVCLTLSAFYLFEALDDPGRDLPSSLSWLPVAQVVVLAAAFLILPVGLIAQLCLLAPERNFLRLDAAGLTFMRCGKSRTWAWPELSLFERDHSFGRIKFLLPNLDPEQARRDRWVHEMTPKGAMVVIPDAYDTPLDKIIAQLNAFRARALGERPDPDGAGAARPSTAAAAMPPVTFGEKPWRKRLALAIWPPLSLLCGVVAFVFMKDLLAAAGASGGPVTWLQFWIAIFAMAGTFFATGMVVVTLLFGPSLRLDGEGLTYARRAANEPRSGNRHWSWSELSTFECEDEAGPRIRFLLPKLDPEQARRDPWVREVTPEGALVVIHDIYDTPLDEIAAKLNDYRARALAAAPGQA